jgi:uncharacterized protein YcaQ
MDRMASRLTIGAVHLEPDAPRAKSTGKAVTSALRELAGFLGANSIEVEAMPDSWQSLPAPVRST